LENEFKVFTDIPPLPALCECDKFIMEKISKVGMQGQELMALNLCWMWLCIIIVLGIIDDSSLFLLPVFLKGTQNNVLKI